MTLILLSLLAGVLTILSPCVLPLLPIIIGGSMSDDRDKLRPLIITGALTLSIILFTLLLKASTVLIDIPAQVWEVVTGVILISFGIVTLFPVLWERLALRLNLSGRSNQLLAESSQKHSRWGSVLIGFSLGPVFSSCSPTYAIILATVLPQNFGYGLLNLVAYAAGLAAMLLLVAVFGQRVVARLKWAANPSGWFKKALGALFIVVGLLIALGLEKDIETALVQNLNLPTLDFEASLIPDNQ